MYWEILFIIRFNGKKIYSRRFTFDKSIIHGWTVFNLKQIDILFSNVYKHLKTGVLDTHCIMCLLFTNSLLNYLRICISTRQKKYPSIVAKLCIYKYIIKISISPNVQKFTVNKQIVDGTVLILGNLKKEKFKWNFHTNSNHLRHRSWLFILLQCSAFSLIYVYIYI